MTYIITYKGKPATLERLYKAEHKYNTDHYLDNTYLVGKTKAATMYLYIYYFGYTWAERTKGVDVKRVAVS